MSEQIPVHGFRLITYPVLDSTNDTALALIADGVRDAVAVRAELQQAGRGRQGRVWLAPPGNLNLSIILADQPRLGGMWSLLAGIVVSDALRGLCPGIACCLKWPNDLMIGNAKLGGILIERRDINGPIVMGIGVNIVAAPPVAERAVTALADHGYKVSAADLAHAILEQLARWRHKNTDLAGMKTEILIQWRERAWGIGLPASWSAGGDPPRRVTGIAQGLDRDGAFVIVDQAGQHHRIMAGEVGFDAVNH